MSGIEDFEVICDENHDGKNTPLVIDFSIIPEENWYEFNFIIDSKGVITKNVFKHYVKVWGRWFDYSNKKLEIIED